MKQLKDKKWKPGTDNCRQIFCEAVAAADPPPPVIQEEKKEEKQPEKLSNPKASLELIPTPVAGTPVNAAPLPTNIRSGTYHVVPGSR